jgi:hemerythrin-like metal-binding protein
MSFIKWRDSYNTGVEQFDQEHHKLVELIDTMYHAIRDKSDVAVTVQAWHDLMAYTSFHFTNEEQAMAAVSYPELEAHRLEHARLKEQAESFREKIEGNAPGAATELYHFLREWLVTHIQECDQKYGSYLTGMKEAQRSPT